MTNKIGSNKLTIFGLLLSQKALAVGLNFFLSYILIKNGSEELYGEFIYILSFLMLSSVFLKFGFDISFTKILGASKEAKLSTQVKNIELQIVLVSILFILATIYFFKPYFSLFFLSIPLYTLMLLNAGKFKGINKSNLSYFYYSLGRVLLFSIGLMVLYFFTDFSMNVVAVTYLIAVVILYLSSYYFDRKSITYDSTLKLDKNFFSYNINLAITSFIYVFMTWGDRFSLGLIVPPNEVSIYDIGLKIALLLSISFEITNAYYSPIFSANVDNKVELEKNIRQSIYINVLISALGFFAILIFGKFIIGLFIKNVDAAYLICLIFTAAYLVSSLFGQVLMVLQMTGIMQKFLKTYVICLLVHLLLGVAFTIYFKNSMYMAIFLSLNLIIYTILGSLLIKKELGINTFIISENVHQ